MCSLHRGRTFLTGKDVGRATPRCAQEKRGLAPDFQGRLRQQQQQQQQPLTFGSPPEPDLAADPREAARHSRSQAPEKGNGQFGQSSSKAQAKLKQTPAQGGLACLEGLCQQPAAVGVGRLGQQVGHQECPGGQQRGACCVHHCCRELGAEGNLPRQRRVGAEARARGAGDGTRWRAALAIMAPGKIPEPGALSGPARAKAPRPSSAQERASRPRKVPLPWYSPRQPGPITKSPKSWPALPGGPGQKVVGYCYTSG